MNNKHEPKFAHLLLKQGLFYSVSVGIESLAPFFLLPVLTRYLSPSDYGYWVLFVALTSFMRPILGLTLQDAVRMRFFDMDQRNLSRFVTTASLLATMVMLLCFALFTLLADTTSSILKFPAAWLWSVLITAYLHGLFYTSLALLQFQDKKAHFAYSQLLQTITTLTLTIVLVVLGYGWQGAVIGKLLSLALSVLVINQIYLKDLKIGTFSHFSLAYCKQLLSFGLRYLPAGLSAVIIPLTDRLFIAHMVNVEETGYFGIGGLFNMAIWVLVNGFIFAWQPILFRSLRSGEYNIDRVYRATGLFYLILPLAGIGVVFTAQMLNPILLGPEFHNAQLYVFWLVVAGVIQGFFTYNQTFLHCKKIVNGMSFSALIAIVINPVFNWILIKQYGGIGAAWATAIAYGLACVSSGYLVLRSVLSDIKKERCLGAKCHVG